MTVPPTKSPVSDGTLSGGKSLERSPHPVKETNKRKVTNLLLLNAPAGHIKVSFDVYDQAGNMNHAPNGVHELLYNP